MSYQSPSQDQAQVASKPWTNGAGLITGATLLAILGGGGYAGITATMTLYAPHVATNAALTALSSSWSRAIRDGYYASGDAPPLTYLSSASACALNAGAGDGGSQIPTSDGKCWLASFGSVGYDPREWGAKGDGATDNNVALTNETAYLVALPNPGYNSYRPVPLNGLNYATSLPFSVPPNIHLFDGAFTALAGASWTATDGSVTIPDSRNPGFTTTIGKSANGVLTLASGVAYNDAIENVYIDVNRIAGVTGVYCAALGNISFRNVSARHWGSGGAGEIVDAGCSVDHLMDSMQEWNQGDAEYHVLADQNGVSIGVWGYDNYFHSGIYSLSLVPIYIAPVANNNNFETIHPWQEAQGGVAWANPLGIIYDATANNTFVDTYLDSVPLLIRSATANPYITFVHAGALYSASETTFNSFVQFTTSRANTSLANVMIDGYFPATGSSYLFSFATTGSGSWGVDSTMLAAVAAATGNSAMHGLGDTRTDFFNNLNLGGKGSIVGTVNVPATLSGAGYTFTVDDGGQVYNFSHGSTVALTASASLTRGGTTQFILTGAGGTITAASGGTVNGVTTAITLIQNKPYTLTWLSGTGANASYMLSGSGI